MGFDTDTSALQHRARLNSAGELRSLDDWIITQLSPRPGMRVLDLGCGTGKQTFRLAREVSPGGSVLGLDISAAAVSEVNRLADESGLPGSVTAIVGSFDDCVDALAGREFELITAAYAVYYASDMVALLMDLRRRLAPGGSVFVCGPGTGTNREIREIINRALSPESAHDEVVSDFLSADAIHQIATVYREATVTRLDNGIRFPSASAVMDWWRHHNSYRPTLDHAMETELRRRFREHGEFVLTKNVLGVRFAT